MHLFLRQRLKLCRRWVSVTVRQCLHVFFFLSVLFSFLIFWHWNQKFFHESDLKLTGAFAVSQNFVTRLPLCHLQPPLPCGYVRVPKFTCPFLLFRLTTGMSTRMRCRSYLRILTSIRNGVRHRSVEASGAPKVPTSLYSALLQLKRNPTFPPMGLIVWNCSMFTVTSRPLSRHEWPQPYIPAAWTPARWRWSNRSRCAARVWLILPCDQIYWVHGNPSPNVPRVSVTHTFS